MLSPARSREASRLCLSSPRHRSRRCCVITRRTTTPRSGRSERRVPSDWRPALWIMWRGTTALWCCTQGHSLHRSPDARFAGVRPPDARFARSIPIGVSRIYTVAQLDSTLRRCDFHFSVEIPDAYLQLTLWAGCAELCPIRRPVMTSREPGQANEVICVGALVKGCTLSTCRGGCDKDLSGILIDGFVFRFTTCQFGQKTAGSPLGCFSRAVEPA